jgi:hypothetical protein
MLRATGAPAPDGHHLLFRVRADGRLEAVTQTNVPPAQPGDIEVLLGPDGSGSLLAASPVRGKT